LKQNKENEGIVDECLEAFEVILKKSKSSETQLYEIKDVIRKERNLVGDILFQSLSKIIQEPL